MISKYSKYFLLIFICAQSSLLSAVTATSRSFFFVPPTYSLPMIRSFYRHDKEITQWGAWEVVPYVSHSTNPCKLTQYFMPFGKTELNVFEYHVTPEDPTGGDLNPAKDIEARHFNIQTNEGTFHSRITFAPEHSVVGAGFTVQQTLFKNCLNEPRLWLEVSFPVEQVKHRMNFKEEIINDGGGAVNELGLDNAPRVGSMTQAFKQENWNYGKIDNQTRTVQGVADVSITLNWGTFFKGCYSSSALGFVVPTGTKIDAGNAAYVFSPVLGNNHHWEILFGNQLCIDLWHRDDHSLKLYFNGRGSVIIRNFQIRSFDSYDKSWSRYMETYLSQAAAEEAQTTANPNAGTSGINVFTHCFKVDPRYQAETKTALTYQYKGLLTEFGGGLYMRHSELFDFNVWEPRVAFKDVSGDGNTNLARTIGKNFPGVAITNTNDFTDALVYLNDLNVLSATHPSIITALVYGTIGYEWMNHKAPVVVSLGSSYDFSQRNTTIDRWSVWGKLAVSF